MVIYSYEYMTNMISVKPPGKYKSCAPAELKARLSRGEPLQLLDVREFPDYAGGRIASSRLAPLGELERWASQLDRSAPIICVCRSGKRAAHAAAKLLELGFSDVSHLQGGLLGWERAGLPLERDANAPWPLERQVRLAAGLLILTGLSLSLRWPMAIALSWFVGAGLTFAGLTDWCGMALLLAKAPWNKNRKDGCCAK